MQVLNIDEVPSLGRVKRLKAASGRGLRCTVELAPGVPAIVQPSQQESASAEESSPDRELTSMLKMIDIRTGAHIQFLPFEEEFQTDPFQTLQPTESIEIIIGIYFTYMLFFFPIQTYFQYTN